MLCFMTWVVFVWCGSALRYASFIVSVKETSLPPTGHFLFGSSVCVVAGVHFFFFFELINLEHKNDSADMWLQHWQIKSDDWFQYFAFGYMPPLAYFFQSLVFFWSLCFENLNLKKESWQNCKNQSRNPEKGFKPKICSALFVWIDFWGIESKMGKCGASALQNFFKNSTLQIAKVDPYTSYFSLIWVGPENISLNS